jgi:hypothetical protein
VELLERNMPTEEEDRFNSEISQQLSKPSRQSGKNISDLEYRRMKEDLRKLRNDNANLLKKVNHRTIDIYAVRKIVKKNSNNYI